MKRQLDIFVDGACKGNPGEAGIGVVINEGGTLIKEISKAIGPATNNIAEYSALICALEEAVELKATHLNIVTDSELVHRQVIGRYKVKDEKLKVLFDKVCELSPRFEKVEIRHVLRANNKEADRLATLAIKKKQTKIVAPLSEYKGEESPSSRG